jgi:hypothetical protein
VVEAESETGLKIIETLQEEEQEEAAQAAEAAAEDEEVEVDPSTYVAEAKVEAEETPAEEPVIEEDKFYTK